MNEGVPAEEKAPEKKRRSTKRYLFVVWPADPQPSETYFQRCKLLIASNKDAVAQRTGESKYRIERIDENPIAKMLVAGAKFEDIG